MKRKLFTLTILFLSCLTGFSQSGKTATVIDAIPNFDFETWDSIVVDVPTNWYFQGAVSKIASYDGSFAVQCGDGSTMPGIVLLGTPAQNGIGGGAPFAARPDTLIGHFNYNIEVGDTGYIALLFKQADTTIYQAFFPIVGSSGGNWVTLKFPITFPNATVPDSMNIGVIGTNVIGNSHGNFPTSVIKADNLTFTGTGLPIPDGNFEDWTNESGIRLDAWATSQDNLPFNDTTVLVAKTTDSYHGTFAAKMQNNLSASTDITRAQAGLGGNGFPVTSRHTTLNGYLKWAPQNNDTLQINVNFTKNGSQIGGGTISIDSAISAYQAFVMNISYGDSTSVPDTAMIYINLGNNNNNGQAHGNSVLYLDYLAFDNSYPTGINTIANALNALAMNVYPNPTNGLLNLEYFNDAPGATIYQVTDITGKVVYTSNEVVSQTGRLTRQINATDLTPGIYLVSVKTISQYITRKVVIEK